MHPRQMMPTVDPSEPFQTSYPEPRGRPPLHSNFVEPPHENLATSSAVYDSPTHYVADVTSPTSSSQPATRLLSSDGETPPWSLPTSSNVNPSPTPSSNTNDASSGLSTGAIVAAVVIPVIGLTIIVIVGVMLCRRRRQSSSTSAAEKQQPSTSSPTSSPLVSNVPNPPTRGPTSNPHLSPLLPTAPIVVATHNNAYFSGLDTADVDDDVDRPSMDAPDPNDPPPPYSQRGPIIPLTTHTDLPSWSRPASQTALIRDSLLADDHRARSHHSESTSVPSAGIAAAPDSSSSSSWRSSLEASDRTVSPVSASGHSHDGTPRDPFADPPSPIEPPSNSTSRER